MYRPRCVFLYMHAWTVNVFVVNRTMPEFCDCILRISCVVAVWTSIISVHRTRACIIGTYVNCICITLYVGLCTTSRAYSSICNYACTDECGHAQCISSGVCIDRYDHSSMSVCTLKIIEWRNELMRFFNDCISTRCIWILLKSELSTLHCLNSEPAENLLIISRQKSQV